MKSFVPAALVAATSLAPLPALASDFEFRGGALEATAAYVDWGPLEVTAGRGAGSVEMGFAEGGFVQLDGAVYSGQLRAFGGPAGSATVYEGTGHLGWDFGSTFVGVFGSYATDLATPATSIGTMGGEVVAPLGPVTLEAYGSYSTSLAPFAGLDLYQADAELRYDITDQFSLAAGGHYAATNIFGVDYYQARLSARYAIGHGMSLDAGYAYTRPNFGPVAHSVGLSFTKTFGGGTTFGRRDMFGQLSGF